MKSAVRGGLVALLVLLAASAAPPAKKPRPPQDPDLQAVIALEQKLWQAWKVRDLATIKRLCAPDYRSVSEDGPEQTVTLDDVVASFKAYRLREITFGRMAAHRLAPDTVIVAYNARISATFEGEDVSRDAAEASIWVRRDGRWLNAFLHEVTTGKPKKR